MQIIKFAWFSLPLKYIFHFLLAVHQIQPQHHFFSGSNKSIRALLGLRYTSSVLHVNKEFKRDLIEFPINTVNRYQSFTMNIVQSNIKIWWCRRLALLLCKTMPSYNPTSNNHTSEKKIAPILKNNILLNQCNIKKRTACWNMHYISISAQLIYSH